MGADIHVVLEVSTGDPRRPWREADGLRDAATNRNYSLFAALAGVRGDGPEPRGLPDDTSHTVKEQLYGWDCDAHSMSWLPLDEAAEVWRSTSGVGIVDPHQFFFGVSKEDAHNYRVIFWFDN